jgi:4-amino-4-deoxy-L-arabinose transferase-like glycosyltransferase
VRTGAHGGATVAFALIILLVLTRLPLAPEYLYHFDSVNFALALDEYNPALHRPQPPGYPLFVAVAWLLHLAIPSAESTLVAAGLLASAAALVLLWRLGVEMFNSNAGLLAAALLIFNPPFWFGALTNQVRLYLAFCSIGLALLAWRALRTRSAMWLYAAFGGLGIAAGFRPGLGVIMLPLLIWVWLRTGGSPRRLVLGFCAAFIAAVPWVAAVSASVGGLSAWFNLNWGYVNEQFSGSSAPFGASLKPAWMMAKKAFVWNGLGALAWIWAIPFVIRRVDSGTPRDRTTFAALWFLPPFAFSALIHIGDPDQALTSIPALCLAGGALLSAFLQRIQSRRVIWMASAVAAVNAVLFFVPPKGIAQAAGYRVVASRDAATRSVIETVRQAAMDGPVTIVHYGAEITWRHVAYYFPEDYVIYAPEHTNEDSYILRGNKAVDAPVSSASPSKVVLITKLLKRDELLASGWLGRGPVYYRSVGPGGYVDVGLYRIAPGSLRPWTLAIR